MTHSIDQTLPQSANLLPNRTLIPILTLQYNLSKPDPNGTKYFVRFRQDPDYSDSSFHEELL